MGYIYIIKYYDDIIAAADNDRTANNVIQNYIRSNGTASQIDKNAFTIDTIRYIKGDDNDNRREDSGD